VAWYRIFAPDLAINSYHQLTIADLNKLNCRLLAVDIDNTLVGYHQETPDDSALAFLKYLQDNGIKLVLISNNSQRRVATFCQNLPIPYYAMARKPLPFVYKKIMRDFQVTADQMVGLGDQLLTDVLGAHLAKIKVIWSQPLFNKDIFVTKFNRFFERQISKLLLKKGLINEKM